MPHRFLIPLYLPPLVVVSFSNTLLLLIWDVSLIRRKDLSKCMQVDKEVKVQGLRVSFTLFNRMNLGKFLSHFEFLSVKCSQSWT